MIEKAVREAYRWAYENYPDSIMRIQEGVNYYVRGFHNGQQIYIWVDVVEKKIRTAFPK